MLSSIIVDDESRSRESLQILLTDFCEGVEVVSLCQNVKEGIEAIELHDPDIVFLDIQMQRETGFDLLASFKEINFEIIFTTAYSDYAIKAFQFCALDYLLKPIDVQDLQNAITKVKAKQNKDVDKRLEILLQNLKHHSTKLNKIALPCNDGLIFIEISDILYCEASSNYTKIYTIEGKNFLVSKTLKEYENMLGDHNFFRIHHTHLVNLNFIQKYVRGEGGHVVMNDGTILNVSKRKKEGFIRKLGYL
ncbi:LytR/AlgR family response regulator transcription factor [Marinigracilibium pacificum]|uniref:Response regulator transcription factor n=1 Tax=Marinigracilibium pacificum TaxID=2729599 RepID=A0A848IW91_9BACT|nr:LytTR family DNA-binding domain-containing protein [Marinigracilibium pacificum]NMM47428.1 response regulator transcription factor [Marinigracilibium pacificum]